MGEGKGKKKMQKRAEEFSQEIEPCDELHMSPCDVRRIPFWFFFFPEK